MLYDRHAAEFHMRRRSTLIGSVAPQITKDHFNDDHSLQAKHDKTHPVC